MSTGNNIRNKRLKLNMTEKDLAKAVGVQIQVLRNYEIDKHKPKLKMLSKLAKALNCKIEDLDETNDPDRYITMHSEEFIPEAWERYCELCGVSETSDTITIYFNHKNVKTTESDYPSEEREREYVCSYCGEIFTYPESIDEDDVLCPTCGSIHVWPIEV